MRAGVVGSLSGGLLLDHIGSSLRNANLICAGSCLLGFVLVIPAFSATRTFAQFMGVFALGQLSLFVLQVGKLVLSHAIICRISLTNSVQVMIMNLHALALATTYYSTSCIDVDICGVWNGTSVRRA